MAAVKPVTVRLAIQDDLDFVSQDGYLPKEIVRRKVEDGDVFVASRDDTDGDVFVAAQSDTQVGYLRLERIWWRLPYIELIRVLEGHRRSGVGRALLEHVEREVASRGHSALYSSSQVDEPEPQAWHRRMGFVECGILAGANEGGIGEVFFRKEILPQSQD